MFKIEKRTETTRKATLIRTAVYLVIAILLAFVVAGLLIEAIGVNPFQAYRALFEGSFGSTYRFAETLLRTTPLLLIGLGVALGYQTGMFNMGGEGQFIMGMLGASLVLLYVHAGIFTVPLAMLVSIVFGGIYCGFPGAMKAKFGISESIINIMLNYIASLWLSRLLNSVLKDPDGYMPQTAMFDSETFLPLLISNTRLHIGFIFAIVLAVIFYIVIYHTPTGYKFRAIGSNKEAARYAGFRVSRYQIMAMVIAGAMAGLSGCIELTGIHHRLMEGISANFGWDAIPVALIGKLNPIGIIFSSLLFAALKVGSNAMQTQLGVPNNLSSVMQGLVILFALGSNFFVQYRLRFVKKNKAEKEEVQING